MIYCPFLNTTTRIIQMNGIINIYKPSGMTSFDVIAFLRKLLKIKKIGHCGTLDPGAEGVLVVCIGKATKVIEYLISDDKIYRAELTLGISTDTQDSFGKVLSSKEVLLSEDETRKAVNSFVGISTQIPPMYSAIKVGGKKLYELARKGQVVEREPRKIHIYSIDILKIEKNKVTFDVKCSKGTYIRTLCSDIGDKLQVGGYMSSLIRIRSGDFESQASFSLESLEKLVQANQFHKALIKPDEALKSFDKIFIDAEEEKKFINGAKISFQEVLQKTNKVRVYNMNERFLGIGRLIQEKQKAILKADKLLI